ncbi:arginine--tRNA ligase [Candidatus Pacearchaeota archaeon ex4484_71]|nr:MAG: arginine--tRNA ligase [Candidatus Pacearchaeota archaeon ex4484_71]
MKDKVIELIEKSLIEGGSKVKTEEIKKYLEIPKDINLGDFAFPCFFLAKDLKQSPNEIAIEIRKNIGNPPEEFEDIQTSGPYVNFFIDKKALAKNLLSQIKKEKEKFGAILTKPKDKKTILVEFPSPNTNKPLHLGHLRNMAIGESISRIAEFNGLKVIRANLNNDRGIHICQSMAAYEKYGEGKTPEKLKKKSDHFVGDYYVLFNEKSKKDKDLEVLSHRMLQKYEEGDKKVLSLWKKMNKWALEGFDETYKRFGIKHDKIYYESKIFQKGKEIILGGVKKGVFEKKEDGSIFIDLGKKLGEKILLRSDGTSVYITQDIYLAKLRFEEYNLENLIYVVGNEQEYHFEVLFKILEILGIGSKSKMKHLSYGMVNLPEGRMKSREGTVVDADDLIKTVQDIAIKELEKRAKLSKKELRERSLAISLSAIKYLLLKIDAKKNMMFNPKESINFEGDTGPYIQYSYARASSILSKSKKSPSFVPKKLGEKEKALVRKISDFPDIVEKSYHSLNPSIIASYAYSLAQLFNEFYHESPVIGSDSEEFRIALVEGFKQVLGNALFLLGIDVLEEM